MSYYTHSAVIIFPASTIGSCTGFALKARRRSSAAQWQVAFNPDRRPAAPKIKLPVQTEVVQRVVSCILRTHAKISGFLRKVVA